MIVVRTKDHYFMQRKGFIYSGSLPCSFLFLPSFTELRTNPHLYPSVAPYSVSQWKRPRPTLSRELTRVLTVEFTTHLQQNKRDSATKNTNAVLGPPSRAQARRSGLYILQHLLCRGMTSLPWSARNTAAHLLKSIVKHPGLRGKCVRILQCSAVG